MLQIICFYKDFLISRVLGSIGDDYMKAIIRLVAYLMIVRFVMSIGGLEVTEAVAHVLHDLLGAIQADNFKDGGIQAAEGKGHQVA
jgi:hypothetical protein